EEHQIREDDAGRQYQRDEASKEPEGPGFRPTESRNEAGRETVTRLTAGRCTATPSSLQRLSHSPTHNSHACTSRAERTGFSVSCGTRDTSFPRRPSPPRPECCTSS